MPLSESAYEPQSISQPLLNANTCFGMYNFLVCQSVVARYMVMQVNWL